MTKNKLALAIAASAFTTTLVGGVALAGFQLPTGEAATPAAIPATTDALAANDSPKDKIKAVLDGLVLKGTLTQAQEDAILKAIQDAAPKPNVAPKPARPNVPSVKSFIGDLAKAASDYLGLDLKTLTTQLRSGKSVADIANSLGPTKSSQGLIATLTTAANAKVDQAVAAKKLTAEQGTTVKAKIPSEITTFVNRSFTKPVLPRPLTPVKPTPTPTPKP